MNDQTDDYCGIRAGFYTNLAAHEYIYKGSINKAIDPTHYSGYEEHMYVEEYLAANPGRLILARP